MFVSRALLGFLSLDCCVCISRTFRISFVGLLRLYLAHFQDLFHWIVMFVSRALLGFLSLDCYLRISRTFRILFHWIVAFVFSALLRFSFIGLLHWYLAHFQDFFHWIVAFVSRALLGFLSLDCYVCFSRTFRIYFIGLLCSYLAHFQNSLSLDCCVCIQRTFRILFHWIVTFVSRALLGFPIFCIICKYFHQYLAQFQESRSFDYYLSISWDFFFMRSSCQYVEHFQDSLLLDSCVCISRTFRILFHQIFTLVSRAL